MHGRLWFLPILVLTSWVSSVASPVGPPSLHATEQRSEVLPGAARKPALKKGSAAIQRSSGSSATVRAARGTKPRQTSSVSGGKTRRNPAVRRYAAQNSLLRRLAAAGLLRGPASGEPRVLEVWRIRLVDGDTFWYGGERIRIRGYDAPERSQPGGFDAARRLETLIHEGEVRIYPHGFDIYGRTLADVFVAQRNVADIMIAEGHTKKRKE